MEPLEEGGTSGRRGIAFQDYVAANFCLEMLLETDLDEVWCETQDDITLIRNRHGKCKVEYVQSKRDKFDSLWSVARLTARENGRTGSSILEKSLANDRASEPCSFTIVTARDVHSDLKPLIYDFGLPGRDCSGSKLTALLQKLQERVGDFSSRNGRDVSFWLENAQWKILHSLDSVKRVGKDSLRSYLEKNGNYLVKDQLDELYERVAAKVNRAARRSYWWGPERKRLTRNNFRAWLDSQIESIVHPASSGTGEKLENKMSAAEIAPDTIASAQEQRRKYRAEVIRPKFLSLKDRDLMEAQVSARLHLLKSRLDSGDLDEDGNHFHARCLTELADLSSQLGTEKGIPLPFLFGYMYNVVDRCLHRFVRYQ
ncbi:MAG TPA: dsDNA nuclease domain-containing protein [Pyrinomonadaceae bacterium]|nr:dsDNA nuclease domain-containing protein [Pyrinomonadaceae bacterium]